MNHDSKDIMTSSFFFGLLGLFVGALVIAGPNGVKLVQVGPFMFDGGLIIYSVTFICTDIITEIFGKQYARKTVIAGFFGMIAALLLTKMTTLMPSASIWDLGQEYDTVLGVGSRVIIAAMISYIVSQSADLYIYAKVRDITGDRHLWLRNNASTLVGGFLDATIFSTIAFYGIHPLQPIIMSAYIVRVATAFLDTPIVYLARWWYRRRAQS